jgi:ribosomal protein S18 acetylase RimI-like enzyme
MILAPCAHRQIMDKDECVGCIVCKLEPHKEMYRGYIAMLAVKKEYRGRRLGAFGGRIVAAYA